MDNQQTGGTGSFIRYNPQRVDYSISESELNNLREAGSNQWKDFSLVSISLGIPCLINAIHDTPEPFKLTLALFLNYFIGILGLVLGLVFCILYLKTRKNFNSILNAIKNKPIYKLDVTQSANTAVVPQENTGDQAGTPNPVIKLSPTDPSSNTGQ
jgi:hypothetical protein